MMTIPPAPAASPTAAMQISSILQRLRVATLGAAARTKRQLTNGLEQLRYQGQQQKNVHWLSQTAWLVDTLKHDAMNGLDIALIVDETDPAVIQKNQIKIKQAGAYARNALFSAASPLQCAHNFSVQVEPFALLCKDVATQLDVLVNKHTQDEWESLISMDRAKPSQGQGQSPDGEEK